MTVVFVLQNLLTPLAYRCLPTLIIKLSLYYTESQYNLTIMANASPLIYLLYVIRLVTLTSLLRAWWIRKRSWTPYIIKQLLNTITSL